MDMEKSDVDRWESICLLPSERRSLTNPFTGCKGYLTRQTVDLLKRYTKSDKIDECLHGRDYKGFYLSFIGRKDHDLSGRILWMPYRGSLRAPYASPYYRVMDINTGELFEVPSRYLEYIEEN